MLNKTLTFGLGKMFGYKKREDELFTLTDDQREQIYKEIRKGFYDFARLCNITSSLMYTSKTLKIGIEDLGFNTGYKLILDKMDIDTHLSGSVLNQAFGIVKSHFSGEHGKKLMKTGESVLPSHRSNGTHPICFHTNAVNIIKYDDAFYMLYNLFKEKWARSVNLPCWIAFRIKIKRRDKSGAGQLERIITGDWKKGSGQLVRSKRINSSKYLMHLVVKYEPEPYKNLSPKTFMGIDLGVTAPAVVHIRKNGKPEKWSLIIGNGKMMLNARGIVRGEIKRLLRGLKRKDSPLQGPARNAALERLRELRKQEQRIMKTASQKIAAQISDIAKRNGAGVWQLEDINKTIKENKPWLARNWAPGMLIDAIRWQADQLGIDFRQVDPKYTSQRCCKCGFISPDNRPKGSKGASYFACTACGNTDHADKNAAQNLSIDGIELIIEAAITSMNEAAIT